MVFEASSRSLSVAQRQAIVVLGMHRSGTSALSSVIHSLGVTAPKTLMLSDFESPSGYWESKLLTNAHDELLASAGSRWDDWRQLNPEWFRSNAAQPLRKKIAEILQDEYGDAPLFLIKDPRLCRFAPMMFSILNEMSVEPIVFLILRNPLEVAFSLRRRDGMTLPKALTLWLRHVLEAEYHSRHLKRYFMTYDQLIMDWRHHLDRAAEMVGIVWPARSDLSAARVEQFLAQDLRRQREDDEASLKHADVSPLVSETYRLLRAMWTAGENRELFDRLDTIRGKFEDGCKLFGPIIASEELLVEQSRSEIGQQSAQLEHLRALVEQQRAQSVLDDANFQRVQTALQINETEHQRVREEATALAAERESLQRALSESEAGHQRVLEETSVLAAERESLRRALSDGEAQRQGLFAELSASETKCSRLNDDLHTAKRELGTLRADLARKEADLGDAIGALQLENQSLKDHLDSVFRSQSWRVTGPMRFIKTLLTKNTLRDKH